ncbi:diguanylate cyclase [Haliea sp. E17]|uniref:sensor domain-containing diguanylate cyclase n=1 Tax=Haliea sp. E17 TaxID=3401576 RepID=UPI003AABA53D
MPNSLTGGTSARAADRFGYIWLLLIFAVTVTLYPFFASVNLPPEARDGVLNLNSWNAGSEGPVQLSGNWEFYWNELLEPGQFENRQPRLVPVPGYWTDYPGGHPPGGFATFRLRVKLSAGHGPLALYSPGEGSAYAIWVNGTFLGGVGEVGTSAETTTPARFRRTFFLPAVGGDMELVVQIANFHHRKAGFRNPVVLGAAEQMHDWQRFAWVGDGFVLGIVLAFALQYLVLYLFHREDKSSLFFSLLCSAIVLRGGLTSQGLLAWLLPEVPWGWMLRLEYVVFFLAIPLYSSFMRSLYPQEYSLYLVRLFWWLGAVFSVVCLVIPTLWASYVIIPYQFLSLLEVLLLGYCLFRLMVRKRPYWLYIATASLLVAIVNVLEALGLAGVLPYGNLTHVGFLAFLMVQAVMLSARSAGKDRRLAELSSNLEQRNLSLQQSERKYRTLFEESQDVIFITDMEGRIIDVSPSCAHLLGYRRDQILAMDNIDVISARDSRRKLFDAVIERGTVVDWETHLAAKDGSAIPVSITSTRRFDEQGQQVGFQGYVRDLSDRVEAEEQRLRADQLETLATIDPLTRTFNRRYFQDAAAREIARAERQGTPLSLVLFDIDHFKSINDRYGHVTGDKVINTIAQLVNSRIRSSDVLGRYGGEEFVILLPDTILSQAHLRSEELRQLVEDMSTESQSREEVQVTISLGVAQWQPGEELTSLLERADRALYASKQKGRNRVTVDLLGNVSAASVE